MLKYILVSFIGIAISIWTDTGGVGDVVPDPPLTLKDRFGNEILDRANAVIATRA